MPKPPVLAVVHNINGDISNAIDSITHRLLRNPNGYTAEQILAEMGPKAAAFLQHIMSGHSYLGTPPPALPTLPSGTANAPVAPPAPVPTPAPIPVPVVAAQPPVVATQVVAAPIAQAVTQPAAPVTPVVVPTVAPVAVPQAVAAAPVAPAAAAAK